MPFFAILFGEQSDLRPGAHVPTQHFKNPHGPGSSQAGSPGIRPPALEQCCAPCCLALVISGFGWKEPQRCVSKKIFNGNFPYSANIYQESASGPVVSTKCFIQNTCENINEMCV